MKTIAKLAAFLLFYILSLWGCHKTLSESSCEIIQYSRKDDIIGAVEEMWCHINATTKNQDFDIKSLIDNIETVSIPTVKSQNSNQDSVYIVNFKNEGGFALVTIENSMPSVIALTDSGNIDGDKLFNNQASFTGEEECFLYRFLDSTLCEPSEDGPYQDYPQETKASGEEYDVWYTDTIIHPLLHIKWGQKYPFNMCMPVAPDSITTHGPSTDYRGRYSVGCTIVAAMQIMTASEHPYSMIPLLSGPTYDLYLYSDVSYYANYGLFNADNYDLYVSPYLKNKTEQLASLMRYTADYSYATYEPNGATGAYSFNAMALMASLDNDRYGAWNIVQMNSDVINYSPDIYSMIASGKPFMISGYYVKDSTTTPPTLSGHTWVIDGYLSQHITRPNGHVYRAHYVHFNWGYQGKYDGYYRRTKVSTRLEPDLSYDTNPASTTNVTTHYNMNLKYILY